MSLFFCPSFSVRLLLRQVLAQVEIFDLCKYKRA